MTPLINNIWNLIEKEYNEYSKNNPLLKFNKNKKNKFREIFQKNYNYIIEKYMDKSVKNLDRHKVASLIIISFLEISPISIENLNEDCVFVANELISLKSGLAYMINILNEKLKERDSNKLMNTFIFPEAQSCRTSYIDIMCRNLYYAKHDYTLNPLDLAERLFLIEYISLIKTGIDPNILKDY